METQTDLAAENRVLQQLLRTLSSDAAHNEAVMGRYQERELSLLTAQGLRELLERLTMGMQAAFRLDAISVALADPNGILEELMHGAGIDPPSLIYVHLLPNLQGWSELYAGLSQPWLGPWSEKYHARLFELRGVRSVALLPLWRGDCHTGVLNLGSRDPKRFTGNHATDFLARFATISAVCVENAINRERLRLTGLTDPLTGLYNRRYLEHRLNEEVARAGRHRQPLACMFIDADHFKRINDTAGHAAGDHVLVELGRRIRAQLRSSDLAIRYGGEEFVLILPQTRLQEAACLGERIRACVADEAIRLPDGRSLRLTVSVGASQLAPYDNGDAGALAARLLESADQAVYAAKNSGRNRVCIADDRRV